MLATLAGAVTVAELQCDHLSLSKGNNDVKISEKQWVALFVCLFIIVFSLSLFIPFENARVRSNHFQVHSGTNSLNMQPIFHCVNVIHFIRGLFIISTVEDVYIFVVVVYSKHWSKHVIVIWSINRPLNKHPRLYKESIEVVEVSPQIQSQR